MYKPYRIFGLSRNSGGLNGTAENIFYVTDQAWISRPQQIVGQSSWAVPEVKSGVGPVGEPGEQTGCWGKELDYFSAAC